MCLDVFVFCVCEGQRTVYGSQFFASGLVTKHLLGHFTGPSSIIRSLYVRSSVPKETDIPMPQPKERSLS